MTDTHTTAVPDNLKGLVADWSSDVQTFKVRWSKAMMWIFLLSDTFIFGSFLSAYMAVRLTTTEPWPGYQPSLCPACWWH
jgi:cytochrome c oxidase subunit 3